MLTSSIQQINTLFYILSNKAYIILSYLVTLNETSDDILEMATTQSQKCFIKFIREKIVAGYSDICNLIICRICDGR